LWKTILQAPRVTGIHRIFAVFDIRRFAYGNGIGPGVQIRGDNRRNGSCGENSKSRCTGIYNRSDIIVIDTSIIVFAAFVFKSVQLALYAMVTLYISSKVIDAIWRSKFCQSPFNHIGLSGGIASTILRDLDRGVTALKGKGMFTGSDKEVLLCGSEKTDSDGKKIVRQIDKKAFIVLTDIREVLGEGF